MIPYLFALFLINSYTNNYSLGGTIPDPNSATLTNLLKELGASCGNPFLLKQIQAKLNECSNIPPRPEEKLIIIQCMLFYDINKQLCDAVAAFKFALPDEYSDAINAPSDVEDTCAAAPKWNFTELPQIPSYSKDMIKIFQGKHGCTKVCEVPDVTSSDTNFFCKYFMWGWNTLSKIPKMQVDPAVENNKVDANIIPAPVQVRAPDALPGLETNIYSAPSITAAGAKIATKINETSKSDSSVIKPVIQHLEQPIDSPINENKAELPVKKENDDIEMPNKDTGVGNNETPVANQDTMVEKEQNEGDNEGTQVGNKETTEQKDAGMSAISDDKIKNSGSALAPSVGDTNALDKPSAAEVAPSNKEQESSYAFNETPLGAQKKMMKPVIEPEQEYNDQDEGKEGLLNGDDNADDPSISGEIEPKPEIAQPQTKNTKAVETSMSFVGEREFYPMQDQFVEDDDHFFPFFLSGIILVVLLYILYHNKSKVTKVVLGLIVEGRQPGRRRNSRGHAYKRLDTLEQAMSTNSAAPPSKIIY